MIRSWDIFCSVVDNFGDIGVCWRLARQLAGESGHAVRLWVDDLASFRRICRAVDSALESQRIGAVEVLHWGAALPPLKPADIVIEGFGIRLPDTYIEAMAARTPHPVWINLEHLSAEPWVDGCHGLPSPHPRLPLTKYFYFPGFNARTGGLLIERELAQARGKFQADADAIADFWRGLGIAPGGERALSVSLFCYANAALPSLIDAWSSGQGPVLCVVPEGKVLDQVSAAVGSRLEPGSRHVKRQLTIAPIPFLDIDQYDRLLWACDVNFVRGEDSFVRAQLAARPLVWQAYVQEEGAHLAKQSAFLDLYLNGLDDATAGALRAMYGAWNRQSPDTGRHWEAYAGVRSAATLHACAWAERLIAGGNLAIKLAEFCQDRLE